MFRKLVLSASLGLSALVAVVPNVAFAQSYGGWSGQYRSDEGYRDGRYDDRESSYTRQRWIAHRRWEQEQRRREWQREHWRGGDDRRDGWDP
ncbi:hypothetical protein GCM10008023_40180 [Sphingomonas glacialis]|uniref:Uncharacterized protein n=1 Tax=Sphingomonas glacialis TaxID=658225 RepID=A0ABQ3LXF9_9SPHN|nr:hypothetical protein [Sphingomonas glacialis]GHH26091.1 hypothetical protein GCM10008023_40180 [Sphingomonas glacialis]